MAGLVLEPVYTGLKAAGLYGILIVRLEAAGFHGAAWPSGARR